MAYAYNTYNSYNTYFFKVLYDKICHEMAVARANIAICAQRCSSTTEIMQKPMVSQISVTDTTLTCRGIALFSRKLRM